MDGLDNNIDTKKLISLIEARPALYDKSLPSNGDRLLKQKLWIDICKVIVPGWEDHTLSEKSRIGINVYNRWQFLRTCFKKEYYLQKEEAKAHTAGRRTKKRKQFELYDQLQFLMPANIRVMKRSAANSSQETNEELMTQPTRTRATSPFVASASSHDFNPSSVQTPRINTERLSTAIAAKSSRHIDEDRHFLLSLLPSLQRMTTVQKLKTKMKFLQAISDIEEETQQTMQQYSSCASYGAGNQDNSQPEPFTDRSMETLRTITSNHSDHAGYSVVGSPIKRIRIMQGSTSTVTQGNVESDSLQEPIDDSVVKDELMLE